MTNNKIVTFHILLALQFVLVAAGMLVNIKVGLFSMIIILSFTTICLIQLNNDEQTNWKAGQSMFIPKCKKCGGKVISAYTNIEIETNGVLKTVTNTPAKKCSKCGHIIVDDITMEKAKQYANDYPANTIDYAMCEAEEVAVIQTLLL